jgi:RHS repeat-associated protein
MKEVIKISLLLLSLLTSSILLSQTVHEGEEFTLDYSISGDHIYKAKNNITIENGFSYTPGQNESFVGYIDPFIVEPPGGGSTGGTVSGDDGVVGSLPGIVNINDFGNVSYSIPIKIPVGTNGLSPQHTISYVSQTRHGLCGIGWDITGFSTIERVGHNLNNDGIVRGVKLDNMDNFSIDGQRLIHVNDLSSTSSEYKTYNDNFSKIVSYGVTVDGPQHFKVWMPDGTTYLYGTTVDSKIEAEGSQVVLKWKLNRVEDIYGNFIEYQYYENNQFGESHPIKIIYGEAGNSTGFGSIEIEYEGLPDKTDHYIYTSKVGRRHRVKNIQVKYENNLLYKYNLEYELDFYSHLISVQVEDKDGVCYNPTRFEWGDDTESMTLLSSNNIPVEVYVSNGNTIFCEYFNGDFNGDGKTDLFVSHSTIVNELYKQCVLGQYFISNGQDYNIPINILPEMTIWNYKVADFDGDNIDEVVGLGLDAFSTSAKVLHYLFKLNNDNSVNSGLAYCSTSPSYSNIPQYETGDFNGDGKSELMYIYTDNEASQKIELFSFNDDMSVLNRVSQYDHSLNEEGKFLISCFDFNGDGKSDYVEQKHEGFIVLEWNGANNWSEVFSAGQPDYYNPVFWGDYNGDGKMDYMNYYGVDVGWSLSMNAGNTFNWDHCPITRLQTPSNFSGGDELDNHYLTGDFNGDGNTDIVEIYSENNANNLYTINMYYSANNLDSEHSNIGVQGFYREIFNNVSISQASPIVRSNFRNMDFNGDGKQDLLFKDLSESSHMDYYLFHSGEKKHYVKSFNGAMGSETKVTYKTLCESNEHYDRGTGAVYPLADLQIPLTVATEIEFDNGIGGKETTSYHYDGLRAHLEGKGLQGFSNIIATTPHLDTRIKKTFAVNNGTHRAPYLYSVEKYCISEDRKCSRTDYRYRISDNTGGTIVVIPRVEFSQSWDLNGAFLGTSCKLNTIDNDNHRIIESRVLNSTSNLAISDPNTSYDYEILTEYEYVPQDEVNWILNRPDKIKTSSRNPQESELVLINRKDIQYYSSTEDAYPKVKWTKINKDETLAVMEQYEYDQYGNLTKTILSAPNSTTPISPRIVTQQFTQNTHFRFPETKSKIGANEVLTESFEYSPIGNVINHISIDGSMTEYFYNGFGELHKTIEADEVQHVQALRWVEPNDTDAPANSVYYKWSAQSGLPASKVYFDMLGRSIRSVGVDHLGNTLCSDKNYNAAGQLIQETQPYKLSDPSSMKVISYQYDPIGRLTKTTHADGTYTEVSFDGFSSTSTYLGQSSTKTMNIIGQLIESEDAAGNSVLYGYNREGLVSSTMLDGNPNSTITTQYDINGNRTTLFDPNTGTITSEYNPFGEIVYHKNANGHEVTTEYDDFGRVTKETNPEGDVFYTYVSSGNGLSKLQQIATTNHSILYEYDEFSRLTSEQESILGAPMIYRYSYTYDAISRLKSKTMPSGLDLIYHYNNVGQIDRVYSNSYQGNDLWAAQDIDDLGRITEYSLGNNLNTSLIYNSEDRLVEILTESNQNATIQHLIYNWFPNGNLESRMDNRVQNQRMESFTYDNLNRLLNVSLNGSLTEQMQYDFMGNITSKSTIGSYSYNNTKIHALDRVTNLTGNYPLDNQSITYTHFNKAKTLFQDNKRLTINYGYHKQRISQTFEDISTGETESKYFSAGGVEQIEKNNVISTYEYISGPTGIFAVQVSTGTQSELYYLHKDHLGSIVALTDRMGNIVQEMSFDAWGNRRNASNWNVENVNTSNLILSRGFTGHEHLDEFGLINMNGRIYDPKLSRFLSPDPYIQMPEYTQNLNRYSYCLNNPLVYVDPSGEILVLAAAAWLLFSETGYEVQKYISPVAVHIDVKLGSHQTGLGFDVSVGVPKAMPVSYRYNFGKTYYWQTYGDHSGWETRKGGEWTLFGMVNYSGTTFSGAGYPREQTTNTITLGGPFVNLKYENDTYLGNFKLPGVPQGDPYSDGYRTAGARIKVGALKVGMILHTGDSPSPTGMQQFQDTDGDGIADAWVMTGGDVQTESQSHGIFYVGFGHLRIGRDTEKNRHRFQNKWAHDGFNGGSNGSEYPWVMPFWGRDSRWYFQFWGGTGSTLY